MQLWHIERGYIGIQHNGNMVMGHIEGVEKVHGWWNSVMGHMAQGRGGNKVVGLRLWCIRKGYGGK